MKDCEKVMREDQYEVTGGEWMMMYEQREDEKRISEDEKMKEYPADDGQVE